MAIKVPKPARAEGSVKEMPTEEASAAPAVTPKVKAPRAKAVETNGHGKAPQTAPQIPIVRRTGRSATPAAEAAKPVRRTAGAAPVIPKAPRGASVTLSREHRLACQQARKHLDHVRELEGKADKEMWEVAEIVGTLLSGEPGRNQPTQRAVAAEMGVDHTTVSTWAKTWRMVGRPDQRFKDSKGKELSFDDHAERIKMFDEQTGQPADPEKYAEIEKFAEDNGIKFSVAKRKVGGTTGKPRSGGSPVPSSHSVLTATDRAINMASQAVSAMGDTAPSLNELSEIMRTLTSWTAVAQRAISLLPDGGLPEEIRQTVENLELAANKVWAEAARKA
jgi:hypothetical protein